MKIRSGEYGIYNGKEYRISKKRDGTLKVIIDDVSQSIPSGFHEKKSPYGHIYYKQIQKEELEEVYYITTYAIYLGKKRVLPGGIVNGKISVAGDASEVSLGFECHGLGEYVKDGVPVEEIDEFIEEREPYDINDL